MLSGPAIHRCCEVLRVERRSLGSVRTFQKTEQRAGKTPEGSYFGIALLCEDIITGRLKTENIL